MILRVERWLIEGGGDIIGSMTQQKRFYTSCEKPKNLSLEEKHNLRSVLGNNSKTLSQKHLKLTF